MYVIKLKPAGSDALRNFECRVRVSCLRGEGGWRYENIGHSAEYNIAALFCYSSPMFIKDFNPSVRLRCEVRELGSRNNWITLRRGSFQDPPKSRVLTFNLEEIIHRISQVAEKDGYPKLESSICVRKFLYSRGGDISCTCVEGIIRRAFPEIKELIDGLAPSGWIDSILPVGGVQHAYMAS